jgi:hypothetical protein
MSSGTLKRTIESKLNRKLSPDVFYPHLSKMVAGGQLIKVDEGRGRHVYYSISENTKKQRQLNILKINDQQELFKNIYGKILLWEFYEGLFKRISLPVSYLGIYEDLIVPYDISKRSIIESKSELVDFLSGLQIEYDSIEWGTIVLGSMYTCNRLIEEIQSPTRFAQKIVRNYCVKEMKYKSKVYDDLLRFSYPKKDDKDFMIYALETWQIQKDKDKKYRLIAKLFKTRYLIFLPGVTLEDISIDKQFSLSEIQDAIRKLEEGGLIKHKVYGRQIRYVMADKELREFINDLKDLFRHELDILLYRWENIESPTSDERDRMEKIFGKEKFNKISLKCELNLHKHKKKMRSCKTTEQYHEFLKENVDYVLDSLAFDVLLEEYKSVRKKNFDRARDWNKNTGLGREKRWKRNEQPTTLKEHRESIKGYRNFLRNKIKASLGEISYDKGILEKYGFLSDLFKLIWPRIYQHLERQKSPDGKQLNIH